MEEIVEKVQQFLNAEYELNKANYLLDDPKEWEKLLAVFRAEFLTDAARELWFKIPVQNFTPGRRKELMARIAIRKVYLIKITGKDIINVFASFPDNTDNLRNCLVFKQTDDEIRLLSSENICDDCLGGGYVEEKSERCNRCQGRGFGHSKTVELVNWKTVFVEPQKPIEVIHINLPSSELQVEMIRLQQ